MPLSRISTYHYQSSQQSESGWVIIMKNMKGRNITTYAICPKKNKRNSKNKKQDMESGALLV